MDNRLQTPWTALKLGIGLMATLAGIDKWFNLLADWGAYVNPVTAQILPMPIGAFMGVVGVVEVAVGAAILAGWTRLGAYVASAWLFGVAINLVAAGLFDIAVRDVVISLAAFTLARLTEVRADIGERSGQPFTAHQRGALTTP